MRFTSVLALFLLCGCSSIKIGEVDRLSAFSIADTTHHKYLVGNNTDVVYRLFKFTGPYSMVFQTDTIELVLLDKNKLDVTQYHSGQVNRRSFKGKFFDQEFKLKKQTQLRLLPPIVWSFRDDAYSFMKDKEGRLLIYNNSGGTFFITLLPFGGTTIGQNKYTLEQVK